MHLSLFLPIKVGTSVGRRPPRRSRRAELPHRAPQECAQVELRSWLVSYRRTRSCRVGLALSSGSWQWLLDHSLLGYFVGGRGTENDVSDPFPLWFPMRTGGVTQRNQGYSCLWRGCFARVAFLPFPVYASIMLFPHPSAFKLASGCMLLTRCLPRVSNGLANITATLGSFYWLSFETTGLSPDKKRLA